MDSRNFLNLVVAVVVLVGVAVVLYRPRVQSSERYQALVVPLANIMDVGFLVLSPVIVLLVGYDAPWFMLGLCLVAMSAGWVMSYNIRNYEPLVGIPDRTHSVAAVANWALFVASMVNIAYYAQLLTTLVLLPMRIYTEDRATWASVGLLLAVTLLGYRGFLPLLNRIGDRTTAFNLAAIFAVLASFAAYNISEAIAGRWELAPFEPAVDSSDIRKVIGFFAMVQGFEASRYIGSRYSGELRIRTMRSAQLISAVVFVALIALSLLLFSSVRPAPNATAIFVIAGSVSPYLPWLIVLAAFGSQLSAITNATSSRSDLLIEATRGFVDRKYTVPILLVPAMVIVVVTDVTAAVSIASRVFAAYFVLQATIAGMLALRNRQWRAFTAAIIVGVMLGVVMIFGLPV